MTVLRTAESQLPMMVGIVQRRLMRWKRRQPNSSAHVSEFGRPKTPAPQPHDAAVAKEGKHRPVGAAPEETVNSTLAAAALEIGNAALGVGGEHIGDYYCAEKLGWGKEWDGHDKGGAGRWKAGQPSKEIVGKLSKGGSPKDHGKLFKLGDGANGTGIDAVWHASGRNQGKPYAVVEYKSDFERNMPAFLKKNPGTQRKPGITGKLAVSGVPKVEDMLTTEPPERAPASSQSTVKRDGAKRGKAGGSPAKAPAAGSRSPLGSKGPLVQMSREWIRANMPAAVGGFFARDVLANYSRHLIYTPIWLPGMAQHAASIAAGQGQIEDTHRNHDVIANLHYEETEVRSAVNRKMAGLRAKHPKASSLETEI